MRAIYCSLRDASCCLSTPCSWRSQACKYSKQVLPAQQFSKQFSTSTDDTQPLIVSAEAAHVTARRHLALVHIPDFIAGPPNEAARGAFTACREDKRWFCLIISHDVNFWTTANRVQGLSWHWLDSSNCWSSDSLNYIHKNTCL